MRSIQLVAPRTLELHDTPEPADPGPGEVLVRLRAIGICGSDMHWYLEGGIGTYLAVYPQVLGHEPAGEVVAAGHGVADFKAGDRVALEPSITCGACEFCLAGQHNNCVASIFMGSPQMPGLLREYAVLPARNVTRVPGSFSFAQATIIEPLAVILHVLELVQLRLGDTVAVLGAGPIGMLCAAVARVMGASKIFVSDPRPHRLALATRMGADVAIESGRFAQAVLDHTGGRGVDVVLDAAGKRESVQAGLELARIGGQYALIGIPSESMMPVDLHMAMAKELRIQTIKRSNHNAHEAIALLASGRIPDAMVTHRLPLERAPWGFETLANYDDNVGKVVVEIPA